jgi:transcriptional antiterminator NusG
LQKWYLLKVFSGDENKIKELIERQTREAQLTHRITRVVIPVAVTRELKRSKLVDVRRKMFSGQIALEICGLDEDLYWFITKLPGVQGFSSGGTKPIPLRDVEVSSLISQSILPVIEDESILVGMQIRIKDGPFAGVSGSVKGLKGEKADIEADMFGSLRKIEIPLSQLQRV